MNKLLEVYSKGLYDSLSNEGVVVVVEHSFFVEATIFPYRDRVGK